MNSLISVSLLFSHLLLIFSTLADAQYKCNDPGQFARNSTYAKNRGLLLSSLASNVTAHGGFYSASLGEGSDKVYGLVLCMTNPSPEDCATCVNAAVEDLIQKCPNQTEAISWGSGDPISCIVRYTNRSISGKVELEPSVLLSNTGNIASNMTKFDEVWGSLIGGLITKASTGSSTLKYAAGIAELLPYQSIYALMQCTPDLSETNCRYCLQQSVEGYQRCCYGKQGGPVLRPSCYFRWDLYPFQNAFNNVTALSPPPPSQSTASPPPTPTTGREGSGRSGREDLKNLTSFFSVFSKFSLATISE